MVTFNFSLKSKPKKEVKPKNTIIYKDVLGLVVKEEQFIKVCYRNKNYVIEPSTFSTKGKKVIYAKRRDERGHRIKIIRNFDDRRDIGTTHYARVTDGLYVIGNVITNSYGMELFYIKRVVDYNEEIIVNYGVYSDDK